MAAPWPRRRGRRSETGAGLIALTWGVLAFFSFLLLSLQVTANLYTASIVSAVGNDAVRRAAHSGGGARSLAQADLWMREQLGAAVSVERARWDGRDGVVTLEVAVRAPSLLIWASAGLDAMRIERQFSMRIEQPDFARARRAVA